MAKTWPLFLFLLFFLSCTYKKEKKPSSQHPLEQGIVRSSALDFSSLNSYIFSPHCVSCHGNAGGVQLQSYEDVVNVLPEIKRVVIEEKSMPPSGPLSPRQQEVLLAWMNEGAPKEAREEPGSSPLPLPLPLPVLPQEALQPKFHSLKTHIFEKKCRICHFPQSEIEDILLETREDLLNSERDLVIPGRPEESALFISVSRDDEKRMPPMGTGIAPLTPNELQILEQWIREGAAL